MDPEGTQAPWLHHTHTYTHTHTHTHTHTIDALYIPQAYTNLWAQFLSSKGVTKVSKFEILMARSLHETESNCAVQHTHGRFCHVASFDKPRLDGSFSSILQCHMCLTAHALLVRIPPVEVKVIPLTGQTLI